MSRQYCMKSFNKRIKSFLKENFEIKNVFEDKFRFECEIDTKYGVLKCSMHHDKSSIFTLFTRFENPSLPRGHLSYLQLNPHTGKYNFHLGFKGSKQEQEDYAVDYISKDLLALKEVTHA